MLKKILIGSLLLGGGVLFIKFILPDDAIASNQNKGLNLDDVDLSDIDFKQGDREITAREKCLQEIGWGGSLISNAYWDCMKREGSEKELTFDFSNFPPYIGAFSMGF